MTGQEGSAVACWTANGLLPDSTVQLPRDLCGPKVWSPLSVVLMVKWGLVRVANLILKCDKGEDALGYLIDIDAVQL